MKKQKNKNTLLTSMNQQQVEIIVKFLTTPQLHFDISLPLKFLTLPKENGDAEGEKNDV